jgi:hypothetical protein
VVDHRDGDEIGESDTTLGADLLAASIEERAVLARRVVAFGLELPEAGSRRDLGPFLSRAARLTAAAR